MRRDDEIAYEAAAAYDEQRIRAAALYCSDGRLGDHVDEFLHQGLRLPRYDRLAVPGGPACLAGHLGAFWLGRGTEEQLRFLIRVHGLAQVVLIAHDGCAFYREELHLAEAAVRAQQERDLSRSAELVRRLAAVETRGFFAEHAAGRVRFRGVPV